MYPERVVVVIPAHDEASTLPQCLTAVQAAAARVSASVLTVVVLDACDDDSRTLSGEFGPDVHFVEIEARSVGVARHTGFTHARRMCAQQEVDESRVWYATTDADTRVDPNWLTRQLDADADMVLGVVRIENWRRFSPAAARRYTMAYRNKRRGDGHGHVHGANMGFTAHTYWQVGGFAPLETGEDVDLVRRFELGGHRIHRDDQLSVVTSARQSGRAPKGFAHFLGSMAPRARRDTA